MVKLGTREEYHKKMNGKLIFGKEDCPFCMALKNEKENIIWQGKYWFLIHNIYPYSGNDMHIMAIPIRHIENSYDLSSEELQELKEVYKKVKYFFGEQTYFSCTRETKDYRSIEHYHTHFIPGKLKGKYLRKMLEEQGFPIKEDMKMDM